MADLDSFFAKKDKKKVKGKKFTTTDEIARRLEETEKKLELQHGTKVRVLEMVKKQEDNPEDTTITVEIPQKPEEEEWNDFKDEADRDMTDLKIAKLQISDDEEGGGGLAEDDGEKGEGGDKKDGVWKTEQTQAPQQVQAVQPTPVEPEEKISRHHQNTSYVPPHMRNMAPSPLQKSTPRRNRTAPDINNEMAFPSLSDAQASNPMGAWGRKAGNEGFESVKHGSTRSVQEDFAPPKLTTANRFDALSDHS
ncbi:hypothetical protein Pcinc_009609 [Petrolisthes cinctipes]|uniref:CDV3 homolog n=1 Tax=Petrolisthes cinctipes TaxID=88211 RepID=A0AAE1KCU0_PETCI|nr:hypothetical protein Pcinc_024557 [Petrolisthes cinctipes]KAK3886225.1 hypothetical protein Pcinc_009609 [Petrolisthes cinctipes]